LLTDLTTQSYVHLAADIARQTHDRYVALIKASKTSRGDGRYFKDVDLYAAQHLEQGANDLFATLMRVQAAEPFINAEERTRHLRTLFDASLDDLLARMTEGRERFLKHWDRLSPPLAKPVPRPEFKALPKAAGHARVRYRELIYVDVTAVANSRGDRHVSSVHNFNAPVGAVQSGVNAVAHVEQQLSVGTSPTQTLLGFAVLRETLKWLVGLATALLVAYIIFMLGWS
jgi:hypothetical protein